MDIVFPEKLLQRDILSKITPFLDEENIILLVGARQVGKTYLLYLLIRYLLKKNISLSQIVYFDLENIHDFSLLEDLTDFDDFWNILKEQKVDFKKRIFVFIDEIQHLKKPSSFLKYLHDHYKPRVKFVVTGSSSLEIKKKFTDRLTGRVYRFFVKPLSFKEFLAFRGEKSLAQKVSKLGVSLLVSKEPLKEILSFSDEDKKRLGFFLREYLIFGGYPAISLRENPLVKQRELQEIYSLYVRRDIKDIGGIEDVEGYNRLVSLLGYQIGSLVREQELSLSSRLSRPTVKKYLFLLENTFVMKLVPPFFTNKRLEIAKTPKVFFEDVGLRNGVINNFNGLTQRTDTGQILENFVYSQLSKAEEDYSKKIRFWRSQAKNEVDFIWEESLTLVYPIEVKWRHSVRQSLPSGLKSFINLYHPSKAFIVHLGEAGVFDYRKTKVYLIPGWAI